MNKTNELTSKFLNKYVKLDSPNYAVMLTGTWGCGKTYFVKEWGKKLSQNISKDNNSPSSDPIYVSLFGLSSLEEINKAVTKEIYPFMKSKLFKIGKTALTAVSNVAFNCDVSKWCNDKVKGDINLELDIVSLFRSENEVGDNRIIIFDDLERCKAPMIDLLGYINTFVEHSNIHVILICNEEIFEKDRDKDKKYYDSFKEKLIGRTFQVEPDIENAIDFFCNNSSIIHLDNDQKKKASDTFKITRYNNIRIFRQALEDYCLLCENLNYDLNNAHQKTIMDGLMVQYIVAYNEYANSDKIREIAQYTPSQLNLLNFSITSDTDHTNDTDEFINIVHKYSFINDFTPQGNMFSAPMPWILNSLKTGIDFSEEITKLLTQEQKSESLSQRLSKYRILEQKDFENTYNAALDYVRDTGDNIIEISIIIHILLSIEEAGIKSCQKNILDDTKDNIKCHLKKITKPDALEKILDSIRDYKMQNVHFSNEMDQFINQTESLIIERYNILESNEILELENVTDDNFDIVSQNFFQHFGSTNVCKYALKPLFNRINPSTFASSLAALTNQHKVEIGNLIVSRYEIHHHDILKEKFAVEYENLDLIRDNLNELAKHKEGLDKFNINYLAKQFGNVINSIMV